MKYDFAKIACTFFDAANRFPQATWENERATRLENLLFACHREWTAPEGPWEHKVVDVDQGGGTVNQALADGTVVSQLDAEAVDGWELASGSGLRWVFRRRKR